MRVYTGRGDDGTTTLLHGGRVPKHSHALEACGSIDEAVAALGMARSECDRASELATLLVDMQKELFVVGAELATAPENRDKLVPGATCVSIGMCDRLEAMIEDYEARSYELSEFVLPGNDRLSAALDFARTVVRRAERRAVELVTDGEFDGSHVVPYLNRFGDLVFLLARDVEGEPVKLHGD